ncbi:MAG: hypothetical protein O3B21_09155 [Proteobacteria bacterium]|nr:hypothetical protein [Pseudomonadota bacterium]MDA1356565.1 hypothetical protein [Pseudomonadota bacterium]
MDESNQQPSQRPTQRLRYPARAIILDYFYTALGLAFTLVPLALVTPLPAVTGVLAGFAVLFFVFGLRTAIRHNTFVEVSNGGVTLRSLWGSKVTWSELREVKLSYFSTRRDRHGGWMQLRLRGQKRTIRMDSTLEGFEILVARAAREARARELELGLETVQNLIALGVVDSADAMSGATDNVGRDGRHDGGGSAT